MAKNVRSYAVPTTQASPDHLTTEEMTLLGEARSEGLEGMRAVGEVLRNRAKYRGTTPEVEALKRKQFSFWNDEKGAPVDSGLQRGMRVAQENEAMWPLVRQAWNESATSNDVQGADMYHADYVNPFAGEKPAWDIKKVRKIAQKGKHIFYREIK